MNIKSAEFIKGVVGPDDILEMDRPKVAFIGRSNVGKSSVINILTNIKQLARTSSTPGRTQQINVFYINKLFYLIDLPGYGYAKASKLVREKISELIDWYLFTSHYDQQLIVFIVDAHVGLTDDDREMLAALEQAHKPVVIVANKVYKIKPSVYKKSIKLLQETCAPHLVIPFSVKKGIGIGALRNEVLGVAK